MTPNSSVNNITMSPIIALNNDQSYFEISIACDRFNGIVNRHSFIILVKAKKKINHYKTISHKCFLATNEGNCRLDNPKIASSCTATNITGTKTN